MFKKLRKFLSKSIKALTKIIGIALMVLDFMKHLNSFKYA